MFGETSETLFLQIIHIIFAVSCKVSCSSA